jgi:hypothetical protein
MTTAYQHRVTIAVPENLITEANHLACIMGESSADIETFRSAGYQDAQDNLYAVCSTVVTDTFLAAQSQGLPPSPPHAEAADRALAQSALDTLGQPAGLMMVVDPDPQAALAQMGLERVPSEEEML